jgi:hypothetical protein
VLEGTWFGDRRPFIQVVRKRPAPTVMIPRGRPRGWGREGYGAGRFGRGDGGQGDLRSM